MKPAAVLLTTLAFAGVWAQNRGLYPDGVDVPRSLTPAERAYLNLFPLADPPSTPPPTGPVRAVAEYEPMEGIIVAWEGSGAQNSILAQLAREVTSPDGGGKVYVYVDTIGERDTAFASLQANGVDMSRVEFIVFTTDTIWCRDYGPRYVYQGGVRAIVKHTYNRPRPNDNLMPISFGGYKNHAVYQIPLIHGGGNYHLDSVNRGFATRLINNENPTLTEQQIIQLWQDYQRSQTTLFQPFPTTVDLTQHIDMWVQIFAPNKVMISEWPQEPGSVQATICDSAAVYFQGLGYQVYRIPAFRQSNVHYTYTNVLVCNGVIVVPTYSVGSFNQAAFDVWRAAAPDKRVVQVNGQALATSAGVFHCVVMHVPKPLGGANPTAYVVSPNGGEQYSPGTVRKVTWVNDDDVAVTSVDILLSLDGGLTYPVTIAAGTQPDGDFDWTVPDVYAPAAKIKVVARDGNSNTGEDVSDGTFAILGAQGLAPVDIAFERGSISGGSIADLAARDGIVMTVTREAPTRPDVFGRPQIEFNLGYFTAIQSPVTVEAEIVSRSVTTTRARLWLRNWNTNEFDQIDDYTLAQTDIQRVVTGLDATKYVRADGRIELKVANAQTAPAAAVYRSFFDFVQIRVRP
jgi:agmatine/peptidylarginine deiminase